MNGINQMIAQGVQPCLRFESPILTSWRRSKQIRQAQQTNALRQAQMQEIERETLKQKCA
jgi:transcriptional regulator of acetoin/glycerol metabolism